MSDRGESSSTSNRFGSETLPGCGVHGGNRVPPGQNQNTDSSDENHYDYCDPKASNHCSLTLLHKCRGIRLLTRFTHVAHHREGLETKNGAAILWRNCSRTDSAGRREPTLRTRVSAKLWHCLGSTPKLIAAASGGGVTIDCGPAR